MRYRPVEVFFDKPPIRVYVPKNNPWFDVGYHLVYKTERPQLYFSEELQFYISEYEFIKLSIKDYYARHHQ